MQTRGSFTQHFNAMKKILSPILITMLLFGQVAMQAQYNTSYVNYSMDLKLEYTHLEQLNSLQNTEGTIEFLLTIEVYFTQIVSDHDYRDLVTSESNRYVLPKHMDTFSLAGSDPTFDSISPKVAVE